MPRGISRASIKTEKREKARQIFAEIDSILPDGLKSLIEFVKYDLQHENTKMAAARCISEINKLDAAPNVQRKLGQLLPEFGQYLLNRPGHRR